MAKLDSQRGSDSWSRQQFEFEINNPLSSCVVVEDMEVYGFSIMRNIAPEAELLLIVITANRRGEGVGRALLEYHIDWMKQEQVISIFLEVREGNTAAQRLYKRSGFTNVGTRKGYYNDGEAAMVMQWALC
ncbi:MAG: ribosomal protein S18-alanine N-acetyltransferase [Fibrobacterales bacterium]